MDHHTTLVHRLVEAARADFSHWKSIGDPSTGSEPNGTIAFYTRFFEKISTGLNAVSQYHHPEDYVARFLERKRIFSLSEEEFESAAVELAEEMVLSGNAPVAQLDIDKVADLVIATLRKWYYLIDRLDDTFFKNHKDTIFNILTYDVTAAFLPGNLDIALADAYAHQFALAGGRYAFLLNTVRRLELPADFAMYLFFRCAFPQGWETSFDTAGHPRRQKMYRELLDAIQKSRSTLEEPSKIVQQQLLYIKNNFASEVEGYQRYREGYQAAYSYLASLDLRACLNNPEPVASQILSRLQAMPDFPSNRFDDESVIKYITEKLRHLIPLHDVSRKNISLPIITHDILRIFLSPKLDEYLVRAANRKQVVDDSILIIISGRSLKFSHAFISYRLFLRMLPQWKGPFELSAAAALAPMAQNAIESIDCAFAALAQFPKNWYASLMKGFTSFYTIKKLIEIHFEGEQRAESLEERRIELYRALFKKKSDDPDPGDIVKAFEKLAASNPKSLSEEQFDELVYLLMEHDIAEQKLDGIEGLLESDKTREKYQQLVFIRFDAYTFNRIMATNAGGLANLFGTKGFIVLIEAYLIGTGLEHVLNYSIEGIVGTIWEAFIGPAPGAADKLFYALDTPFNFTLSAFSDGWARMDWGKTFLSLIIPIGLMFLITGYNYVFFKLRRRENRSKSFRHLAVTTKRWLTGQTYQVSFGGRKAFGVFFELFKAAVLLYMVYSIISMLYAAGFAPTQLALFFFLLSTICLSTYTGNKLKDEVTLGQSEAISDTIRDFIFIPIIEMGKFLSGQVKSINFIPWLVKTGAEPFYRFFIVVLRSFISFQREKKEEII